VECTGDLGFSARKTYDLSGCRHLANTVKSPAAQIGDFQARRGGIRFKEAGKKGTQFVHTLNGSGLW